MNRAVIKSVRLSTSLALGALLLSPALAQGSAQSSAATGGATSLTLAQALALAYRQGPDLANAQTALQDAQTKLRALKADPSAVILDLTQAQQTYALALAQVPATRLTVMQNVVNAYLTLYETQQNIALYRAQADLDAKNVQVARAKLQAKSGTSLDVATAQNTLNTAQQNLANATAQLSVQSGTLAKLFGQTSGQIVVGAPPSPPALTVSLTALNQGLSARLQSTVQAQQAAALQQLNVKLSDNDYTPRLTLQAAQASLQTARRDLLNAQKSAATSLSAAYRTAQDAYKRIPIQQKAVQNQQTSVAQAKARLAGGVISRLELQTTQVTLQSNLYAQTQAVDNYWKDLAALSVAAGRDVTGLVAKAGQP